MADTSGAATTAHTVYEILKDFQPALAAAIALAAATLAYKSAMTKVYQDRKFRREDDLRAKLAVHLKVDAAALRINREMSHLLNHPGPTDALVRISLRADYPDLEDAWKSLVLLSPQAMVPLEALRTLLRFIKTVMDVEVSDYQNSPGAQSNAAKAQVLLPKIKQIVDRSEALHQAVNPEIEKIFSELKV
jgi:hypothetical protein